MTEIKLKVPTTHTALCVLGSNPNLGIQDGDDFRNDYFVYDKDGNKKHKWFMRMSSGYGDARYWPPKMDDLAKLEAKRWRWTQRTKGIVEPLWKDIAARIKENAPFGGYHHFTEEGKGWLEFRCHEDAMGVGISWSWKDKRPAKVRQKLCDDYFKAEERMQTCYRRSGLFHALFLRAVDHNFWDNKVKSREALHLVINGRDYWFQHAQHKYAGNCFEPIAMPEDTNVVKVVLNCTKED